MTDPCLLLLACSELHAQLTCSRWFVIFTLRVFLQLFVAGPFRHNSAAVEPCVDMDLTKRSILSDPVFEITVCVRCGMNNVSTLLGTVLKYQSMARNPCDHSGKDSLLFVLSISSHEIHLSLFELLWGLVKTYDRVMVRVLSIRD